MNFVMEKGCCCLSLRTSCFIIAGWFIFGGILEPFVNEHRNPVWYITFAIEMIGTVGLLIGAILESFRLVAIWLIMALIFFITFPIAICGVIFDFGGFREGLGTTDRSTGLFLYCVGFIIYLFCLRIVYSYYVNIKKEVQQARSNENV